MAQFQASGVLPGILCAPFRLSCQASRYSGRHSRRTARRSARLPPGRDTGAESLDPAGHPVRRPSPLQASGFRVFQGQAVPPKGRPSALGSSGTFWRIAGALRRKGLGGAKATGLSSKGNRVVEQRQQGCRVSALALPRPLSAAAGPPFRGRPAQTGILVYW